MSMHLQALNRSTRTRLYRSDNLLRIAERACEGEGVGGPVELSLLLCDDAFIQQMNKQYRQKDEPTDVLSFCQENVPGHGARALGDIVISLETVEDRWPGDRAAMRDEVRLLFCHGVLHLLGYRHGTEGDRKRMIERQARYLGVPEQAAWRFKTGA